jgi:hypothetical protein
MLWVFESCVIGGLLFGGIAVSGMYLHERFERNKNVGLDEEAPLLGGVHVEERVLIEDLD